MEKFKIISQKKNGKEVYFLEEGDIPIVNKFNESVSEEFKLQTTLLPEPFIGNPEKAKVLFLALNPGFKDDEQEADENRDTYWHTQAALRKLIFDNVELKPAEYLYYYLNEDKDIAKAPGIVWCKRVFRGLIDAMDTKKELSKKICCIQYHAYHSKRYKPIKEQLPSQKKTLKIIRQLMDKNIPIVIMRSWKIWRDAIQELENYENIFFLKNYRNPTISVGNLKNGQKDFDKIVKQLKAK